MIWIHAQPEYDERDYWLINEYWQKIWPNDSEVHSNLQNLKVNLFIKFFLDSWKKCFYVGRHPCQSFHPHISCPQFSNLQRKLIYFLLVDKNLVLAWKTNNPWPNFKFSKYEQNFKNLVVSKSPVVIKSADFCSLQKIRPVWCNLVRFDRDRAQTT